MTTQDLSSFPQLDEAKIKDLLSLDPSKDLLRQLVKIFDGEMQVAFTKMRDDFKRNNFEPISKLAHRLRSTSLNLGFVRLGEIFRQLEYMNFSEADQQVVQKLFSTGEAESQLAHQKLSSYAN